MRFLAFRACMIGFMMVSVIWILFPAQLVVAGLQARWPAGLLPSRDGAYVRALSAA